MEYFKLKNHLYLKSFTNNEISQYNLTTDRHPWREKPMRERANRRTTATCRLRFAPTQIAEYRNFGMWQNVGASSKARHKPETVQVSDAWSKLRKQSWARLLQKVYEVDPFVCPKCQGTMSVVAIIEDPKELAKIINWAKQQEREQPVAVCARSPPELALVSVYNTQERSLCGSG